MSLSPNGANENRATKLFDHSLKAALHACSDVHAIEPEPIDRPSLFFIGPPGRLFCTRHLLQRFLARIDESLPA
jgi:hypothetical protein